MTTEPIAGGRMCILRYCWVEGPGYDRTATPTPKTMTTTTQQQNRKGNTKQNMFKQEYLTLSVSLTVS